VLARLVARLCVMLTFLLFFSSAKHVPFVSNCTSCITLTSAFSARENAEHVLINIIIHSYRIVLLFIGEEEEDTKLETCENVTIYWWWFFLPSGRIGSRCGV
jgi:hypothetical protein